MNAPMVLTATIVAATVVAVTVYVVRSRRTDSEMIDASRADPMATMVHDQQTQMRSLILGFLFLVTVISAVAIFLMIRLQLASDRSSAIFTELRHQEQQLLCFADRNDDFSVALADLLIFSLGNPNTVQTPEERAAMQQAIERLKLFRDRVEEADGVIFCQLDPLSDMPVESDENAALSALLAGIVVGGAAVWVFTGKLNKKQG